MWSIHSQLYRSLASKAITRPRAGIRFASSSSNPFPFPTHANPNPYQIFHLPHNASKADIKRRYIDLVRIYHPDSPVSRALPPELTDGRFQAIAKAHDALRGKTPMNPRGVEAKPDVPHSAAWRAHRARRLDMDSGIDDRWQERLLILGGVFTVGVFVFQAVTMRQKAIAQLHQQSPYTFKDKPAQRKRDDKNLDASDLDAK
ncbi:hypothetical protein FIBSPDRAFT_607267 [Athelia psychrophila]|uniref:J domain-containing protein n=1 Tax=Athelia psychrophila TaxID=1759441 RepID=A0A166GMK4_9AGAM|nr:hypothetical protein FIBSPDRAFT_607267 [Fibularhizoctonia sp. CBS 109695]